MTKKIKFIPSITFFLCIFSSFQCKTTSKKTDSILAEGNTEDIMSAAPASLRSALPSWFKSEEYLAKYGVQVVRGPLGALFLRVQDCAKSKTYLDALKELAGSNASNVELPAANRRLEGGGCEYGIDLIMHPVLAQTLDKEIDNSGVQTNCWGHALQVSGMTEATTEIREPVFTHFLSSPQCKLIQSSDQAKLGDLVVIRGTSKESENQWKFSEVHVAVRITDDLWSSKLGSGSFKIEPSKITLERYIEGPSECLAISPNPLTAKYLEKCQSIVQIFRCESTEKYLQKTLTAEDIRTRNTLLDKVRGFLWTTIYEQDSLVKSSELGKGWSFVSKDRFQPLYAYYFNIGEEISDDVASWSLRLKADPTHLPRYNFDLPKVFSLPIEVLKAIEDSEDGLPIGDGYEILKNAHQDIEKSLWNETKSLKITKPKLFQSLLGLNAELISSQFADQSVRSEIFNELSASTILKFEMDPAD